jgi:hypothetical protein
MKKTILQKFKSDYEKLLAKYPTIHVYGNQNGEPFASEWNPEINSTISLPSKHKEKS